MRRKQAVVLGFYFLLGVVMEFPMLALRWWLKDTVGLDIPSIAVLISTASLPWTIKPIYGLLSDQYPLCGRRRKPYIVLCNLVASALWLVLATTPPTPHLVAVLAVAIQTATCFADVLYDASMVELSANENAEDAGSFQTSCWAARALGAVLAAGGGGVASSLLPQTTVFKAQALFPLALALLATCCFDEPKASTRVDGPGVLATVGRVLRALREPQLWKPALFVCVFASTPSSGTAWFYYLVNERGFSPDTMGALTCVRHGAMFLAALGYRRFCRTRAFRPFFVLLVVTSAALSLTPLLLIEGLNRTWGIPDVFFVGGDDVFLAALGQVAMMPCLVLAAKLCPEGIEASLYATFISLLNTSAIGSEFLGASLTSLLGVSHDNFEGLPRLVVICAATSLLPLLFVPLLPPGNVGALARGPQDEEDETALLEETDDPSPRVKDAMQPFEVECASV